MITNELHFFDVWKTDGSWQWANRYLINVDPERTAREFPVAALVELEKTFLDSRYSIFRVNTAPVPDPGGSGFIPFPQAVPGELNFSGNPPADAIHCVWISLAGEMGLLGRKTYRQCLQSSMVTKAGRLPAYTGASGPLGATASAWTTFMETMSEQDWGLHIGNPLEVGGTRLVLEFTVRERPMNVKPNKQWYNRLPAPPSP